MERKFEDGITIEELLKRIGKHIWLILGGTVLVTVLAVLLVEFLLNPLITSYSLTFSLSYPDSDSMKYPDGTPFRYYDLVSYDTLSEAQHSSPQFEDVDIERMIEEDAIAVLPRTQTVDGVTEETGQYTIVVNGSYFNNMRDAANFIRAIANVPVNRIKTLSGAIDYSLDHEIFASASYADRLELLATQKEDLLAQYDAWIGLFRENYEVDGVTLRNYRAALDIVFSDSTSLSLWNELNACGYVPIAEAEAKISDLQQEYRLNENKISALLETGSTTDPGNATAAAYALEASQEETNDVQLVFPETDPDISQLLAQLISRNEQILFQVEMLSDENILAFESKLEQEFARLQKASEQVKTVSDRLYAQSSAVFTTSQAMESGNISPIFAGVGAFIVGFVLLCLIVTTASTALERRRAAAAAEETGESAARPKEQGEAEEEEPAEKTEQQ